MFSNCNHQSYSSNIHSSFVSFLALNTSLLSIQDLCLQCCAINTWTRKVSHVTVHKTKFLITGAQKALQKFSKSSIQTKKKKVPSKLFLDPLKICEKSPSKSAFWTKLFFLSILFSWDFGIFSRSKNSLGELFFWFGWNFLKIFAPLFVHQWFT